MNIQNYTREDRLERGDIEHPEISEIHRAKQLKEQDEQKGDPKTDKLPRKHKKEDR